MQHAVRYTFLEEEYPPLASGAKSALKMDVTFETAIANRKFSLYVQTLRPAVGSTGLQAGVKRGVIEIHIQDGRVHLNRFKLRATHYMRRC